MHHGASRLLFVPGVVGIVVGLLLVTMSVTSWGDPFGGDKLAFLFLVCAMGIAFGSVVISLLVALLATVAGSMRSVVIVNLAGALVGGWPVWLQALGLWG